MLKRLPPTPIHILKVTNFPLDGLDVPNFGQIFNLKLE